jgi:hypothetical protein
MLISCCISPETNAGLALWQNTAPGPVMMPIQSFNGTAGMLSGLALRSEHSHIIGREIAGNAWEITHGIEIASLEAGSCGFTASSSPPSLYLLRADVGVHLRSHCCSRVVASGIQSVCQWVEYRIGGTCGSGHSGVP